MTLTVTLDTVSVHQNLREEKSVGVFPTKSPVYWPTKSPYSGVHCMWVLPYLSSRQSLGSKPGLVNWQSMTSGLKSRSRT